MLKNIDSRLTRIAEVVPLKPSAIGHHDASGLGAGGVWFPADSLVPRQGFQHCPILWRYQWPPDITSKLVTEQNPNGTITNSDLESAGGFLHLEALVQSFDIRERTVLSKTDNLATIFWQRKGSTTTDKVPAYLLRLFGSHQRWHRYIPRHDYLPGPSNPIADASSRLTHLTDSQFLHCISTKYKHSKISAMDPIAADHFCRDLCAANATVKAGASSGRTAAAHSTWQQWEKYCLELAVDPFLEAIEDKVPYLQVFAQRFRTGSLALARHPLRARSTEDYVRQVAQMFLSLGAQDPRKDSTNAIDFRLQRMLAAWKKEDPPPHRVKPVPTRVIKTISFIAENATDPNIQTISDIIVIAFFFLLRPGEYTATPSDTQPFAFQHVQLLYGGSCIDLATASNNVLHTATFATLTFDLQKNGVRGEVVGQGFSGHPAVCPVKSLARRVSYLGTNNASPTTHIAVTYTNNKWIPVTPSDISSTLRNAVSYIGQSLGFLPNEVSAHCLSSCQRQRPLERQSRSRNNLATGALALRYNTPISDSTVIVSDGFLRPADAC